MRSGLHVGKSAFTGSEADGGVEEGRERNLRNRTRPLGSDQIIYRLQKMWGLDKMVCKG